MKEGFGRLYLVFLKSVYVIAYFIYSRSQTLLAKIEIERERKKKKTVWNENSISNSFFM